MRLVSDECCCRIESRHDSPSRHATNVAVQITEDYLTTMTGYVPKDLTGV